MRMLSEFRFFGRIGSPNFDPKVADVCFSRRRMVSMRAPLKIPVSPAGVLSGVLWIGSADMMVRRVQNARKPLNEESFEGIFDDDSDCT